MARAGPRKAREYSLELKVTAVRLSQQPAIWVQAVAAAFDNMDLPHIKVVLYQEKRVPKSTADRRGDGPSARRDNEYARWRLF